MINCLSVVFLFQDWFGREIRAFMGDSLYDTASTKGEKTKYRLAASVKDLMDTAAVETITVRQICERAGVSRQTFYRNFLDKYDLINWYFDKILLESFRQMGSGRTIHESLVRKFTYIQKEHTFFAVGFRGDEQNNLKEHDFEMIYEFYCNLIRKKSGTDPDKRTKALLEMYCQASVYMTVKWVLEDVLISPEELAQLMVDAMPQRLITIFRELNILN